jgi:hypothetical protein
MENELEAKFQNLADNAKNITLLKEEKEAIKSNLLFFMEKNPEKEKAIPFYKVIRARFIDFIYPLYSKPVFRYASLSLGIILLSTIAVSAVAQNALPGDALYPVKTEISSLNIIF